MLIKTELSHSLSHSALIISCKEGILIPILLMGKVKQKKQKNPDDPARKRQRCDMNPGF